MSSNAGVSRVSSSRSSMAGKKGVSTAGSDETHQSRKSQIDIALIQEYHAYDRHCHLLSSVSSSNIVHRQRQYEIRQAQMQQVHFQSLSIESQRGILQNKLDKIGEQEYETRHANEYLEKQYVTMSTERDEQSQLHQTEIQSLREEIQQAYHFNQEMEQYQRDKPVLLARQTAQKKAVVHEHASQVNNIRMYEAKYELEMAALKREMTQKVKEAKQWLIKSTDECMHPVATKAMKRNLHRIVELEYLSVSYDKTKSQNQTLLGKIQRVAKRTQAIERELYRSASRSQWLKTICENFKSKKQQIVDQLTEAQQVYRNTKEYLRMQGRGVDQVVQMSKHRNNQLKSLLTTTGGNIQPEEYSKESDMSIKTLIENHKREYQGMKPLLPSDKLGLEKVDISGILQKYTKEAVVVSSPSVPDASTNAGVSINIVELDEKIEQNESKQIHAIQQQDTFSRSQEDIETSAPQFLQSPVQNLSGGAYIGSSGSEISIDDFLDLHQQNNQVSDYYNNAVLLKLNSASKSIGVHQQSKNRVRSADLGVLSSRMKKDMTRVDATFLEDMEEVDEEEYDNANNSNNEKNSNNDNDSKADAITTTAITTTAITTITPNSTSMNNSIITSTPLYPDTLAEQEKQRLVQQQLLLSQKKHTGLQPLQSLPSLHGDKPMKVQLEHQHVIPKVHDTVLPLSLRALSNKLSLMREELRGAQSNSVLAKEAKADAQARYEELVSNMPSHTRIMLECQYNAYNTIQKPNEEVNQTEQTFVPTEDQYIQAPNIFLKDMKMQDIQTKYQETTPASAHIPELQHITRMDKDDRWKLMDEWFLNMANAVQRQ